jgi:uncharacterized protein (TIGR03086 family)
MSTPTTPADADQLLDLHNRCLDQSHRLIAMVQPQQENLPTPCTEYDVRTLVDHMIFAARRVAAAGARLPIATEATGVDEVLASDWASAFATAASDARSAWSQPGALDGEIALPFGTFPAAMVVQIYTIEQATHAWDLATAVGAAAQLDAGVGDAVLPLAQAAIRPEYRSHSPMPFGPEVPSEPGASAYDRLAAFMGRHPGA